MFLVVCVWTANRCFSLQLSLMSKERPLKSLHTQCHLISWNNDVIFHQLLIVQRPFQNNVPNVSTNGVTRGSYTSANSPHPICTMMSVFYWYNGFSAQSENIAINLNTKHTHKRLSDSLFTRVRRSLHLKAWIATTCRAVSGVLWPYLALKWPAIFLQW